MVKAVAAFSSASRLWPVTMARWVWALVGQCGARAMRKATERAHKMVSIPMVSTTIPHEVTGLPVARVLLKPASRGTGVIAAGGVRAVLEQRASRHLNQVDGQRRVLNVVKSHFRRLRPTQNPNEESHPARQTCQRDDTLLGPEEEWLRVLPEDGAYYLRAQRDRIL